jgi:hypothetical protein
VLTIGEVVLRDGYIETLDFPSGSVLPSGEAHVGFLRVGPVEDHLGGSLAVDGPVEFVLHCGKEALGRGGGDIVVDGGRVDVGDLLVEFALAQSDFANALELFLEVFFAKDRAVVFNRSSSMA